MWPNISIAAIGNKTLYGFLSEQTDALLNGTCLLASNTKLFSPQNSEWVNLSEHESKMFIDTFYSQALTLNEKGAGLVHDATSGVIEYQCDTLPQWLAPAGKFEAVTSDYVIASTDKIAFYTFINTGFNRQVISNCILPLSGTSFTDKYDTPHKVAISINSATDTTDNRKVFGVNHIKDTSYSSQRIEWQNIYKHIFDIRLLDIKYLPEYQYELLTYNQYPIWVSSIVYTVSRLQYDDNWYHDKERSIVQTQKLRIGPNYTSYGTILAADIPISTKAVISYVHPSSGELISFDLEIISHNEVDYQYLKEYSYDNPWGSTLNYYTYPQVVDGKLGFHCVQNIWDDDNYKISREDTFTPIMDIPNEIKDFRLSNDYFSIKTITQIEQNIAYIMFSENKTNMLFGFKVNEKFYENLWSNYFIRLSTSFLDENCLIMVLAVRHKITAIDNGFFVFIRLDLDPAALDFQ